MEKPNYHITRKERKKRGGGEKVEFILKETIEVDGWNTVEKVCVIECPEQAERMRLFLKELEIKATQ